MSDVPRDPDDLEGTNHLVNQMRDRNIGAHQVRKAIREGEVEDGAKESDIRYRLPSPGVDLLVVVDSRNGKITTAFYDDDQGARRGGI